MLSDKTIYRAKTPSICIRGKNFLRKKLSRKNRARLNENMRKTLEPYTFSVFCNNCLAGVFLHDAGKQFCSPTVNAAIDGGEFVKFLQNPKRYLDAEFQFISYEGVSYPVAMLEDIEIRFVHYHTEEECVSAWRRRAQRIDWDNLFVIATDHDGMGHAEHLEAFDKLPYRNKVLFTAQELPQYPWAVTVPRFRGRKQVEIMTQLANVKGERYYESCFDLAGWIAASSVHRHGSVDVQAFCRK